MQDDLKFLEIEDDLNFLGIEDDLNFLGIEDDLNLFEIRRLPHFLGGNGRQPQFLLNGNHTQIFL